MTLRTVEWFNQQGQREQLAVLAAVGVLAVFSLGTVLLLLGVMLVIDQLLDWYHGSD